MPEEKSAFPATGFKVIGPEVSIPKVEGAENYPGPSREGINPIGANKREMFEQEAKEIKASPKKSPEKEEKKMPEKGGENVKKS